MQVSTQQLERALTANDLFKGFGDRYLITIEAAENALPEAPFRDAFMEAGSPQKVAVKVHNCWSGEEEEEEEEELQRDNDLHYANVEKLRALCGEARDFEHYRTLVIINHLKFDSLATETWKQFEWEMIHQEQEEDRGRDLTWSERAALDHHEVEVPEGNLIRA